MSKYKVGEKMIVEITEVKENSYVLNRIGEVEPMEAKIRRQAAEITRLLAENKKLKENFEKSKRATLNMERLAGQNEAWELVRKIFDMETNDIEDIFIKEDAWNLGTVLNNYTYQEAAAKVAEWEKIKEIKVGDVVSHEEKYEEKYGVVISEGTICFRGFTDDGTPFEWYKERCTKTGRHIDIDSFLKQIGGNENER